MKQYQYKVIFIQRLKAEETLKEFGQELAE